MLLYFGCLVRLVDFLRYYCCIIRNCTPHPSNRVVSIHDASKPSRVFRQFPFRGFSSAETRWIERQRMLLNENTALVSERLVLRPYRYVLCVVNFRIEVDDSGIKSIARTAISRVDVKRSSPRRNSERITESRGRIRDARLFCFLSIFDRY